MLTVAFGPITGAARIAADADASLNRIAAVCAVVLRSLPDPNSEHKEDCEEREHSQDAETVTVVAGGD
jgi:hypothetical protein